MTLTLDLGWLIAVILLSVRVAAATAMAAVFGPSQIPGSIRALLSVILGALLASATGVRALPVATIGGLIAECVGEVLIGAAFAGGFLIAYASAQVAGRILDTQMGFGVAGIFDPATGSVGSLTGTLFGISAVALFLAMNGHLMLIRMIATSAEIFPPGRALTAVDWQGALAQGGLMFAYGLALAGPVMGALLIGDLTMSVFARSLPQLNVFLLGFPLKIMMGLVGLAISVRYSGAIFETLFDSTFRYWAHIATGN